MGSAPHSEFLPSLYILYQYHLNESRRQIILGTLSIVKYPVRRVSPILLLLLTRLCPPLYPLKKSNLYHILYLIYTLSEEKRERGKRGSVNALSMPLSIPLSMLYHCYLFNSIIYSLHGCFLPCYRSLLPS